MQVMVRKRSISEIVGELQGKKVLIWTCNTCARLCNVGGTGVAAEFADELRSAGITVSGIMSQKAICIVSDPDIKSVSGTDDFDVVVVLACNVAEKVISTMTSKQVFTPILVLGEGYRDADGLLYLVDGSRVG